MTSRSRRQTRSRRFGPGVWAPYEHNKTIAMRKSLRQLKKSAADVSRAFKAVGAAAAAFSAASLAQANHNIAWSISEHTEYERTLAHASLLGMDEVDAGRMIEDFRLTRVHADSVRGWEDLRDEITDHCLGFGTARLIG